MDETKCSSLKPRSNCSQTKSCCPQWEKAQLGSPGLKQSFILALKAGPIIFPVLFMVGLLMLLRFWLVQFGLR